MASHNRRSTKFRQIQRKIQQLPSNSNPPIPEDTSASNDQHPVKVDFLMPQLSKQIQEREKHYSYVKELEMNNHSAKSQLTQLQKKVGELHTKEATLMDPTVLTRTRYAAPSDLISFDHTVVKSTSQPEPGETSDIDNMMRTVNLSSNTSSENHRCYACDLIDKMVEQNKLLREALAVCEKGKQRYASLYESTTDELQTAREEIKNAQKQARVFEDMCQRYGLREEQERNRRRTEMANIKKLLQSKEGGEGDESSLVSRLRRQLMKSLDSNRKLVAEISELHSENEAVSTKLTKLRNGMRKGFLHHKEEVEKRKAEKEKKKIETSNQTTQVEVAELSKSYTASIATEVDTGELMKYIMENGHVESFKTVGSQTGPEVAVNGNGKLEKHGSSGRGTSFFNASSSKSPKNKTGIGSQTPKSPRTPKTPKGRTILESKVLQMIYDILEKRCVTDSKAKADSEMMTMVAFMADYFSHKYGVAKLAAQQQANFLSSLLTYKDKNDRVRHFLTLLGEDHEEIFCEEISETYMDMIKGIMLYKNYEGISERLDDGIGNVKLTKKQCASAIFGQDAKLQNTATWKCPFLHKVIGAPQLRAFYNEHVSQVIASSSEKKPSVDFDEFSRAFMAMLITGLEKQLTNLRNIFKGADTDGNGMVDFNEFKKMLHTVTQSEEAAATAEKAREIFQLVNQTEEVNGEDDDPDGVVSPDALVTVLFNKSIFAVSPIETSRLKIAAAIATTLRKVSFARDQKLPEVAPLAEKEEMKNLLLLQQKNRRASILKSQARKEMEAKDDTIDPDDEVEGWDEVPDKLFRGKGGNDDKNLTIEVP
ncbi:hypothetical protein TrST_g5507 [Triparma strigata]|uniref:EF-hand domain-containing protein n=1 Tax=Triparma strigata TaxID=1606541 RepID=A0A9W6ZYM9_9STRA|nr:hypothetical protein TrST_g5507 [Triparma strigata]